MAEECCKKLEDAILQTETNAESVFVHAWQYWWDTLRDFASKPAGFFITLPGAAYAVPVLSEMLQRLQTPLDTGFGTWQWYNQDQAGKTILTLPQAPGKAKVDINGSDLAAPRDYTLAGATLTFTDGLDVGDLVTVKSYGG